MKKSVKIAVIAASGLIVLGIIICVIALFIGGNDMGSIKEISVTGDFTTISGKYENYIDDYSESGSYSVNADNVKNIDIDWVSGDVEIIPYDGDTVTFTESAKASIAEDDALHYGIDDTTLHIQSFKNAENSSSSIFNITFHDTATLNKNLTVKIPKSLIESLSLDSLGVDTASGNINVSDISANSFSVDTASGECNSNGSFKNFDFHSSSGSLTFHSELPASSADIITVSGNVKVSGSFDALDIETSSGDISSDKFLDASELEIDSVSGSISIDGSFSDVEIGAVSGNVEIISNTPLHQLSADCVSGDIFVFLPSSSEFTLDFDTVSGDFDSDFSFVMRDGAYTAGSGTGEFDVETTSGSLKITQIN